jgi:hypothetical protein
MLKKLLMHTKFGIENYVDEMEHALHRFFCKSLKSEAPFQKGRFENFLFPGDELCVEIISIGIQKINFNPSASHCRDDGYCLPHFFGELAKTQEGCEYIRKNGDFAAYCLELEHWHKISLENARRLKSIVWLVGQVTSSKPGLVLTEESKGISHLISIAMQCSILSIKGVAFFALGLCARTVKGRDLLDDFGWECAEESGYCLPINLKGFLYVRLLFFECLE